MHTIHPVFRGHILGSEPGPPEVRGHGLGALPRGYGEVVADTLVHSASYSVGSAPSHSHSAVANNVGSTHSNSAVSGLGSVQSRHSNSEVRGLT